jgi:hypothetical protein
MLALDRRRTPAVFAASWVEADEAMRKVRAADSPCRSAREAVWLQVEAGIRSIKRSNLLCFIQVEVCIRSIKRSILCFPPYFRSPFLDKTAKLKNILSN